MINIPPPHKKRKLDDISCTDNLSSSNSNINHNQNINSNQSIHNEENQSHEWLKTLENELQRKLDIAPDISNDISLCFETIANKINEQKHKIQIQAQMIQDLHQTINEMKNSNDQNSNHEKSSPMIEKLFSDAKQMTIFENLRGDSPKCKLCIEFYDSFMCIISQSIKNKEKKNELQTQYHRRSIIYYSDITHILSLPMKEDIYIFVQLQNKIPINWRKKEMISFAIVFPDNDRFYDENGEEIHDIQKLEFIPETNACSSLKLKPEMQISQEILFSNLLSIVCSKKIEHENRKFFQSLITKKIFIEGVHGYNQVKIFLLPNGILLQPKPLTFVNKSEIEYYETERVSNDDQRGKTFDINLYLHENHKQMYLKNKDNILVISMIIKAELKGMLLYFRKMNINEYADEQSSTESEMESKKNVNENMKEEIENKSVSDVENEEMKEDEYEDSDSIFDINDFMDCSSDDESSEGFKSSDSETDAHMEDNQNKKRKKRKKNNVNEDKKKQKVKKQMKKKMKMKKKTKIKNKESMITNENKNKSKKKNKKKKKESKYRRNVSKVRKKKKSIDSKTIEEKMRIIDLCSDTETNDEKSLSLVLKKQSPKKFIQTKLVFKKNASANISAVKVNKIGNDESGSEDIDIAL